MPTPPVDASVPLNLASPWERSLYPSGKENVFVVGPTTIEIGIGAAVVFGQRSDAVQTAQRRLRELGIEGPNGAALDVDGRLGPHTAHALAVFQRMVGLAAVGRLDAVTLAALNKPRAWAAAILAATPPGQERTTEDRCDSGIWRASSVFYQPSGTAVVRETVSHVTTVAAPDGRAMKLLVAHEALRFGATRACDLPESGQGGTHSEAATAYAGALERQLAQNLSAVTPQSSLPKGWESRRSFEPYGGVGAMVCVKETLREEMGGIPTVQRQLRTFDSRTGQQAT